ncbi:hypothetical protein CI238_11633 [Colletotrichum incanum]|uniref:Uncharacterized protein n=1 Tax=Colletotrichum incanum TaxID=1573173 RepID=A0A162Q7M5_COLIC|nr:hypothetical protein CI238_11633 [Colletotrichum incanum]
MGSTKDKIKATVVVAGVYILVKKILDSPENERRNQPDTNRATTSENHEAAHRRSPYRQSRRYSRSFTESTS